MKKLVSVILVFSMLFALLIPVSAADKETVAEPTVVAAGAKVEYPIIFVTGIGQTWTHLVNEDGSYKTEKGGDPIEYNLFYVDIKGLLQPKPLVSALCFVAEFIGSAVIGRNLVVEKHVQNVFEGLLHYNVIDKEGKLPPDVENVVKPYPLSKYNEMERKNLFRSIPCQAIVPEIGEENIYCFNHSAFDFLYDDADGLNDFIQVVKEQRGVDQVVLIPMSMGAAVTNAYLDRYGSTGDVKRVVSIVGAWDGSDVMADLVEKKFASNGPELFYNGVIADLIGEPWGYVVNIVVRIFPKKTMTNIIKTALGGVARTLVLKTPSLMALIPSSRYEAIEKEYLAGDQWAYIREQTHPYYEAQKNLQSRLKALEDAGMEFYFICGYGLKFGGFSDDYAFFQFMQSAETTNSDEIIHIGSTAPGATFAPFDSKEPVYTGKYASPDGTVDLSTSFAPDRTWLFKGQKHELEYNNTAIRLAFEIAKGTVKDVPSVADTYPQFNDSRDVKRLIRSNSDTYIVQLTNYIEENKADPAKAAEVAKAEKALADCNAMLANTHNDREKDDALMEATYDVLVELGLQAPRKESTPTKFESFMKKLNDKVYDIFGAKGYIDIFKK